MILITLTKPKRKLRTIIGIGLIAFILGVVVPFLYVLLTHAGSMAQFVSKEDGIPGEPIRVTVPPQEGFVDNIWMEELLQVMGETEKINE